MNQEQHPLNLGKLLVNFQSLEFVLRAFLWESEKDKDKDKDKEPKLYELKRGDIVAENAFTNYDSLNSLINKYNRNPKISSTGLNIDKTITDIRDAIAHGRVSGKSPMPPQNLLKFGKPKNNYVRVILSVQLSKEWFNEQLARSQNAVLTVAKALKMLQQGKL